MISRRETLLSMAVAPAGLAAGASSAQTPPGPLSRADFEVSGAYFNAASMHPMPLRSAAAIRTFTASRTDPTIELPAPDARGLFARLINATPAEIAFVPSTTYAENIVLDTLGLKRPDPPCRIVTDVLHFDGSLYMYQELAKRGLDIKVLPMTAEGRVDLAQLESALGGSRSGTQLVAISLVSMVNGFEHDLPAVCEIARRRGALVYVDAVQAAGAVPIDVRASGVDFLAASTFKWLMGDFGFGFLYVRKDLLPKLQRDEFGFRQFVRFDYHLFATDPPAAKPFEVTPDDDTATGRFEIGTLGLAAKCAAATSIEALLATGVEELQRRRQPLIETIRSQLSNRYQALTPNDSKSSILAFALRDAETKLATRLKSAGVTIALYDDRFRISPSIYNSQQDVGRLLDVLLGQG
jgi:selenocysteine lyase/cysteine desulfurase